MPCELFDGCQFFKDHMKDLPASAHYIKTRVCLGNFASCNRYQIYKRYGGEDIPPFLDPIDVKEVKKATEHLRKKRETHD